MRISGKLARLAGVFGVAATMLFVAPGAATATTYHTPPWADLNCSWFTGAGWDGLDTRQACTNGKNELAAAGYTAFANNNGSSANQVMGPGWAQDDAIWALFGHANAGFMTTYNATVGRTDLAAQPGISGNCTGSNACLTNYTTTQLHAIKVMIFGGCYTANSPNGTSAYILPYQAVHYRGVDAAVGWSHTVSWPHMDQWTKSFFHFTGSNGVPPTLLNSAIYAENDTYAAYGDFGGTDSSVWYGNAGLSIRPAAYGN